VGVSFIHPGAGVNGNYVHTITSMTEKLLSPQGI